MKALVAYHTQYGNTGRVATALGAGLKTAEIETVVASVNKVASGSLNQYDFVCLGGPTQYRTASEPMQEFLETLTRVDLSGKAALAFDTRRDSRLAGSAAKYIEQALRKEGMMIIRQAPSAIMLKPELAKSKEDFENKAEWKEWRYRSERLQDGEETEFEWIGLQIGRKLMGLPFPAWAAGVQMASTPEGAD